MRALLRKVNGSDVLIVGGFGLLTAGGFMLAASAGCALLGVGIIALGLVVGD